MSIAPRFIRLRDAPAYLGMDRSVFNKDVRPLLCTIRIGVQGIAFDRLELDAWADEQVRNRSAGTGGTKWREN
jgi:predicted DNA-binding transcriptional regulator AlpA